MGPPRARGAVPPTGEWELPYPPEQGEGLGTTSQEKSSQNHSLIITCYVIRSNNLGVLSFPFKFSRNEVFLCTADVVAADDKLWKVSNFEQSHRVPTIRSWF